MFNGNNKDQDKQKVNVGTKRTPSQNHEKGAQGKKKK